VKNRNLSFHFFSREDLDIFYSYKKIKTKIFHDELSWNLPVDPEGLALDDEFDSVSEFIGCFDIEKNLIGVARSTSLDTVFPHKELFVKEISKEDWPAIHRLGFTINAIAVQKNHRNQKLHFNDVDYPTIGAAMLSLLFDRYAKFGREICLLTAIYHRSDKFFLKNNFEYLGNPFCSTESNTPLINMVRPNVKSFSEILKKEKTRWKTNLQ
jgi:hypothetical protein